MKNLSDKKCVPCHGQAPRLSADEISEYSKQLSGWQLKNNRNLVKNFKFKDFKGALDFVNKIGAKAEAEGHHPDIEFGWGYVKIKLWTHAVDGLSENDFILATKIDAI
jgi:4a-hydroxytetrahydrobiopterin dehydratase